MSESMTTKAATRPMAAKPAPAPSAGEQRLKSLRDAYEKLAAETARAAKDGDSAAVAKLKQQKLDAFQAWRAAETEQSHADREANRKRTEALNR